MTSTRILEIVVAGACLGCGDARMLAELLMNANPPGLSVRLIDLDVPGAVRPAAVFAVPTYVLDGKILSLGNPAVDWLLERLGLIDSPVPTTRSLPACGGASS
jgi:hypothetical protein